MNKMTKGALATGIGVALLLGGGGTLAYWNDDAESAGGAIVAGDLDLTAAGVGTWTHSNGEPLIASTYKVVPGDVIVYTQPLTVTLDGTLMQAELTATGLQGITSTFGSTLTTDLVVKNAAGVTVTGTISTGGTYTAATTFTFDPSTADQVSTNAAFDYTAIGYELVQVAPVQPTTP